MVKVEIVDEHNSPYSSAAPSRTNSSDSLSSVASDASVPDESFYDRLSALVDIVPPTTRQSISSSLFKTTSFIKKTGKVVGNVVWIVTTSALLIGLPLALSLEDEAKIVQQEQEMLAQQQGAQQVLFFSPPLYFGLFQPCFPLDALTRCFVPIHRVITACTKSRRASRLLTQNYDSVMPLRLVVSLFSVIHLLITHLVLLLLRTFPRYSPSPFTTLPLDNCCPRVI